VAAGVEDHYFVPRPLNYFRYFRKGRTRRRARRGRAPEMIALLVLWLAVLWITRRPGSR